MKRTPFLTFLLIILFVSCNKNNPIKETDGPAVKGIIVDNHGIPVSGIEVKMFSSDYIPALSLGKVLDESTDTTNSNGEFQLPINDTGYYNIDAVKDSFGIFIDSINISDENKNVEIPKDTIKRLSTISGISCMSGVNDTAQIRVTIYIPGTGRITKPEIGGKFTFDLIPEGNYQIIFDPTLDDYGVTIIDTSSEAGLTLDLDTVQLRYTGLPRPPENISLHYDTLKQQVTLTWSGYDSTYISGYMIYRKASDSISVPISNSAITDTAYIDSNVTQDLAYFYSIAAMDHQDREGAKSQTVACTTATAFREYRRISLGQGMAMGNDLRGFEVGSDTSFYICFYYPDFIYTFDAQGNERPNIGEDKVSSLSGMSLDDNGNIYACAYSSIYKFDDVGELITEWSATTMLKAIVAGDNSSIFSIGEGSDMKTFIFQKFDATGGLIDSITITPGGEYYGDLVTSSEGLLYAGYGNNKEIQVFSGNLDLIDSIYVNVNGTLTSDLQSIDESNRLYLKCENYIIVTDKTGNILARFTPGCNFSKFRLKGSSIFVLNEEWENDAYLIGTVIEFRNPL